MSKLGVVAILVASILGTVPARAGLESRGQNFPLEVPTPEFSPSSLLGVTSAQDESVVVHGEADGELVMITQQNRSLWAATSSDNGATFSPEVRIAGVPTEGPIDAFRFVATVDALYVAYLVGDPGGDVGLSIRRSMDMGRTWSPPTAIVARGSLRHGINDLRLHANDAGRVAVMFDGLWEDRDVWVTVSSDQGSTWTTPVHLDVTTATQSVVGDIEVGSGGTVHAAIVRQPTSRVFYTRSTDGGLTFAPEISLASIAGGLDTVVPDIVTYPNNTVLVAFWDRSSGSTDKVDVVRSTNDGLSFVATATKTVPSVGSNPRMRLVGAPNFGDAVLAYVTAGELRTSLSQNTGASFDWDAVVGTNVDTFEITRTAANQYVLAWNDTGWMPGVYAALSVDGGFSWGVPKRADQGPGATAESRMGGVTIAGTDRAFFAYLDRRDDLETQMNVYAVDATVGAFDFTGRERRVDTDPAGWDANLITQGGFFASDGASNVYVAIYVNAEEHGNELWVSRSGDGGRTYQPIHKVSTHAPSSFEVEYARIRALPDGRVYVSWLRRDPATSQVFLIFARSTDFGATWGPETVLAGPLVNTQTHLLEATPTAVVAIWEDNNHISIRRSIDGGATFSPASNLDANPGTFSQFPVACSQGSRMLVAYAAADGLGLNPWVRISADSGATWSLPQDLSVSGEGFDAQYLSIACDVGTSAVVAWLNTDAGNTFQVYASRLSGGAWSIERKVSTSPGDKWYTSVTWAGGPNWVLAFGTFSLSEVYTSRSTSGGLNWSVTPVRHDLDAPQPLAYSAVPYVVSDGAGNVWLSWWELSAGQPSIAVRHSADGGATFSAVRRADRAMPQGANWNDSTYGLFAHPGVGFIAWGGRRSTRYGDVRVQTWDAADLDRDGSGDAADCNDESALVYPGAPEACDGIANDCNAPAWPAVPANEVDPDADGLMNCADNCPNASNPTQADLDGDTLGDACDPDIDGDGVANGEDCAPTNPGVGQAPAELTPIQINKPTPTTFQITWTALPGAASYDVVRGTVAALRTSGNTSGAAGQSCSQAATTYSDTKPIPAGTTWYFMVRARNAVCGGSWGANSAGIPRTTAACP